MDESSLQLFLKFALKLLLPTKASKCMVKIIFLIELLNFYFLD